MEKINIFIADDHPLVAAGLTTLLKPYKQIRVLGSYMNAVRLMEGLRQRLPDVLLLDLMLPDRSGKELVADIREAHPDLRILVLTSLDMPAMISSMMRRGCRGYLLKGAGPEVLLEAIEAVHRGETYIEPALRESLLQNVIQYKSKNEAIPLPELSEREKEILQLIAQEYTTREISEKLFISYRTAENHRYNLLQKLDVKNTVGLVKAAIQLGLI